MWIALSVLSLALVLPTALCQLRNLRLYRPPAPPAPEDRGLGPVSVLIPARNEEANIGRAVLAASTSQGVEVEVIVLDDASEDRTAEIVRELARSDPRIRLEAAPALPPGWCGKQHACHALASLASHEVLVFVDADVRLEPEACARMARFLRDSGASLASGIPRQEVGSFLERLLIPLIHFLILGFLPLWRMRRSRHPAYGAGCGQLFAARRRDLAAAGGHAAIRTSLHDGIALPRALRTAGLATDLFDATTVASCRMYRNGGEVWRGLAKNATEGLAAPRVILPATLLLLGGHVLPFALVLAAPWAGLAATAVAGLAAALALWIRASAAVRFRQPISSAALHPVGILVLLAIQWYALVRQILGRPSRWKGRAYPAPGTAAGQPAGR